MTTPTQNNLACGLPTRKILPLEIVEPLTPRQTNTRENLTIQAPAVGITSSITHFPSNKKWIQYLIERYVSSQIEYSKQLGFNETNELDEFNRLLLLRQKKIDFAVNELQPKINPDNNPVKVYYFGAASDYLGVAAATNAGSMILGDTVFSRDFTPFYEAVARSITQLGGQVLEKEINIQSPEVIPLEDDESKRPYYKFIEAGLLELKEGEVKIFNAGLNNQVMFLRLTNEFFLTSSGYILSIKKINQDDKSYQFGLVRFGEGRVNLKCHVPLFTSNPTEREQNITYHTCLDADTSIPVELKDGYDVLYAQESYILKNNSIKQTLYELLNLGGKAVFTIGNQRTFEVLKKNFPMFDFSNSIIVPVPGSDYSYVIVEKI